MNKRVPTYQPNELDIKLAKRNGHGFFYLKHKGYWFKVFATGKAELVKNQPALRAA
jgi:hypothetical protein